MGSVLPLLPAGELMPAKGSCCCERPDTHGLATMWILDFDYGTVLRDFYWVANPLNSPLSHACAFDESLIQAAEVGADHVPGVAVEGSSFLWDANPPETPIWGPLAKTIDNSRLTGGFTPSYFWFGNARPDAAEFFLRAAARSNGADYTHGMTGGLLRTDGTYIYTWTDSTPTHRKYDEAGSLIASEAAAAITTGTGLSYSGSGEHYHSAARGFPDNDRIYEAIDPETLAVNWTLDLNNPNNSSVRGNDEAGGMYLVFGGNLHRYENAILDWSAATPSGFSAQDFGGNGNIYYVRSITGTDNLTKISGADGSIAWNAPIPFTSSLLTNNPHQPIVHGGAIYIPHAQGIWAVDEATGATLWHTTDPICGYSRPVPTSLGLLCCGEYS